MIANGVIEALNITGNGQCDVNFGSIVLGDCGEGRTLAPRFAVVITSQQRSSLKPYGFIFAGCLKTGTDEMHCGNYEMMYYISKMNKGRRNDEAVFGCGSR